MEHREKHQVSVVMVGISSYGQYYLNTLLDEFSSEEIEIRAVVSRFPERSVRYNELKKRGIKTFRSLSELYESGLTSDLVVISSPIHFHVPQSCEALQHDSHVLCEKPIGATVQEADHLIKSRDAAHRWVMIGYQWSYSAAIQSLKKDILKGLLGKPVRLKTLCFWPRDERYYQRNNWAGRKKDEEGNWILDSPANNAMAHFLHNLMYILGERIDRSAQPTEVTAELYRTYPIENFDSVASRVITVKGIELLLYASHTIPQDKGPMFSLEFEQAKVTYGEISDEILLKDHRGNEKNYGSPEKDHQFRKLFDAVATVREPKLIICGPEAARSHTLCINGMQESVPEIVTFPESMVQYEKDKGKHWVKGLDEAFYDCYRKWILPSEAGFSWAHRGKAVSLRNYQFFPRGTFPKGTPPEDKETR